MTAEYTRPSGRERRWWDRRSRRKAAQIASAEAIEHMILAADNGIEETVRVEMRKIAQKLRERGERQ